LLALIALQVGRNSGVALACYLHWFLPPLRNFAKYST
jgi:hypothetical protein